MDRSTARISRTTTRFGAVVALAALVLLCAPGLAHPASSGKPGLADHAGASVRLCLAPEETELARLINEYRASFGLPPVPLSKSLTLVAKAHVLDLARNNPAQKVDADGRACSLHSWSADGEWTPVCYTRDNARAREMWNKPRQITHNAYTGNGFENAYWNAGGASPDLALSGWKRSPSHKAVILEKGVWKGANWPAMGVALEGNYAVVWFGDEPDSLGTVAVCDLNRERLSRAEAPADPAAEGGAPEAVAAAGAGQERVASGAAIGDPGGEAP